MDAMREVEREADLESVKKEFQAINEQAKVDASFDPVGMMREDMTKAVIRRRTGAGPSDTLEIGMESEIALTESASPPQTMSRSPAEAEAQPEAPAVRQSAAE